MHQPFYTLPINARVITATLTATLFLTGCVSYDLDQNYHSEFKSMVQEYQSEAAKLATDDRTISNKGAPLPKNLDKDPVFTTGRVQTSLPAKKYSLESLYLSALEHSSQIKVFSDLPLIRETGIREAKGPFDTNVFVESRYDLTNDPVGSTLTTGNNSSRFRQDETAVEGGVRKKFLTGTEATLSQEVRETDNNSSFFLPDPQANARLALTVMQPILRGAGIAYNRSIMQIAAIDSEIARQEFIRQSESHLLEITRTYWTLYAARANYQTKKRLADSSRSIVVDLEARGDFDAAKRQLLRARAAEAERRANLVRAEAAIRNAEDRLKALVNDPALRELSAIEIIPSDPPISAPIATDLKDAATQALEKRPEILQAFLQLKSGAVREKMSRNEVLPVLNLLMRGYVAGLERERNWGGALDNQFSTGGPGATVGLRFEFPVENNEALAKLERRKIEMRQLFQQLRTTTETVLLEIKVSVREVGTAQRDLAAKYQSLVASREDVDEMVRRKDVMLLGGENNTNSYLEFLLEAQDRQALAEERFLNALATYNVALVSLERAKGNLLNYEGITIERSRDEERDIPQLRLVRDAPPEPVPVRRTSGTPAAAAKSTSSVKPVVQPASGPLRPRTNRNKQRAPSPAPATATVPATAPTSAQVVKPAPTP
jgi:outer membrane protein TolC